MYVNAYVDEDEVLGEVSDAVLREEIARRESKGRNFGGSVIGSRELTDQVLLDRIWMHFRNCPDQAPWELREYIYRLTGKIV